MLLAIIGLVVGFSCGYLVREVVQQRRRAVLRKHFQRQSELVTRQQMRIETLKLIAEQTVQRHRRSPSS